MTNLAEDSRPQGRDLNLRSPALEIGVSVTAMKL
jgi:hypothetical protein